MEEWTAFNKSDGDYETLKFDHNQLTNLNIQIPALKFNVKTIDLSRNKISKIMNAFFKNLDGLEEINLGYNQLETKNLEPEVFEGKYLADLYEPLKNLKTLILSNNSLHSLHPDVFEHLGNLEVLKLDQNVFQVLPDNMLSVFSSILHLRELDMSHMELEELPRLLFHANSKDLKILNLAGNLFTKIPEALKFATELEGLNLNENPIDEITLVE